MKLNSNYDNFGISFVKNTSGTFQKAICCYNFHNFQCSLLISSFIKIQIVSQKKLQIQQKKTL